MFDWSRYVILAEELAARTQDEAALRSAVSRAYYGVFGKTRELLRAEGVSLPASGRVHRLIWRQCRSATEPRRRHLGLAGDWLRDKRNAADYGDSLSDLPLLAGDSIRVAREMLRFLEQ